MRGLLTCETATAELHNSESRRPVKSAGPGGTHSLPRRVDNPVRFHQVDGVGYSFLADSVIELNALNPQVAARMLRIISRWNRYDEKRQQLMKQQLERIVSVEGISKDVYEIAAKSLEA